MKEETAADRVRKHCLDLFKVDKARARAKKACRVTSRSRIGLPKGEYAEWTLERSMMQSEFALDYPELAEFGPDEEF